MPLLPHNRIEFEDDSDEFELVEPMEIDPTRPSPSPARSWLRTPTYEEFLRILRGPSSRPAVPAGSPTVLIDDGMSEAAPAPTPAPTPAPASLPAPTLPAPVPAPARRGRVRRATQPLRGKKKFNLGHIVLMCHPQDREFLVEYERDFLFDFPEMVNQTARLRSQKFLWYLAEFEWDHPIQTFWICFFCSSKNYSHVLAR